MLITFFNAFLIALITFISYKYFALKEKFGSEDHRSVAYAETLGMLADKIEVYESAHAAEIARIAQEIGRAKCLTDEQLESLRFAAWMHDIGEIMLPRELLRNSEKPDGENLFLLRTHPLLGEFLLKSRCPHTDEVPSIIRWHHERWDGTGYPDCLKGDEIPLCSRIIALADAVSAMSSSRPYRKKALSRSDLMSELERQSGLQFDPELVEIFKNLKMRLGNEVEGK